MAEEGRPGVGNGVRAGRERAQEYGLEIPDENLFEELIIGTRAALAAVIENWQVAVRDALDERFIELFAENATVAAIARAAYEPNRVFERPRYYRDDLTRGYLDTFEEGELIAYLAHSAAFFNSMTHRHGD